MGASKCLVSFLVSESPVESHPKRGPGRCRPGASVLAPESLEPRIHLWLRPAKLRVAAKKGWNKRMVAVAPKEKGRQQAQA